MALSGGKDPPLHQPSFSSSPCQPRTHGMMLHAWYWLKRNNWKVISPVLSLEILWSFDNNCPYSSSTQLISFGFTSPKSLEATFLVANSDETLFFFFPPVSTKPAGSGLWREGPPPHLCDPSPCSVLCTSFLLSSSFSLKLA